MTSIATPATTPDGTHELVRRWTPEGTSRAELVLCHGIAEHSGRYERVGDRFAAAGLAVTAYDQIGFGASGGRRAWIDEWADVLDQIQSHVERAIATGRPTILLGHSNGGLFALEYALSERPGPDLLVLSAPALTGGAAWQKALAPLIATLAPGLQIPNRLDGSQLSRDPSVGEAYFADPLVHPKTSARYGAELFAAMGRVNAALGNLATPTLVIHGAQDTIVSPDASAVLETIPGVTRRLYRTLRHELFQEPEGMDVVDDVVGWIEDHLR